ncbi:MAG: urease accessory protein UreF, partial [Ktedonobacterales bacterium]
RLSLDLAGVEPGGELVRHALRVSQRAGGDIHYCAAFGLVLGALVLDDEEMAALTYLQQSLSGLVSACQRLLPLGQSHASAILWRLKPALVAVLDQRCTSEVDSHEITCFTPLVDLGGMRHPGLETRLFIS